MKESDDIWSCLPDCVSERRLDWQICDFFFSLFPLSKHFVLLIVGENISTEYIQCDIMWQYYLNKNCYDEVECWNDVRSPIY